MSGKTRLLLAAVQMESTGDMEGNLSRAVRWIHEAADGGADLVALPENFAFMGSDEDRARVAQDLEGDILDRLREAARQREVLVLAGSYLVRSSEPADTRPYNTSVLLDRRGEVAAVYHKIHLFDVSLPDGVSYRESEHIRPGDRVVTAAVEGVTFGLSVCYDLRFPQLYRALARAGAEIVFVPAAFTLATGKDHWMPLVQARAIENQVYVVAPAQFGNHGGRRQTYGHSAIVDPWGTALAVAPEREGVVFAECDRAYLEEVRSRIPVLQHDRPDVVGG